MYALTALQGFDTESCQDEKDKDKFEDLHKSILVCCNLDLVSYQSC